MILYFNFFRTLEFEHGLILEREDRIKQIEGDILDVNQIMRELRRATEIFKKQQNEEMYNNGN